MRTVRQLEDEHLAVADLARLRGGHDRVEHHLQFGVGDHDLDLDLGHEVDFVLGAAVHLGVALLAAETTDFGDRHAGDPCVRERLLDVVELEVPDNGFDFFIQSRWPRILRTNLRGIRDQIKM